MESKNEIKKRLFHPHMMGMICPKCKLVNNLGTEVCGGDECEERLINFRFSAFEDRGE